MFDHVVMGYATDSRRAPMYPSQMPILEALVTLGLRRRGDGSGHAVDRGARAPATAGGAGGQAGEHPRHPVGRPPAPRRRAWAGRKPSTRRSVRTSPDGGGGSTRPSTCSGPAGARSASSERGERFHADAIAMEPKPPRGDRLPIWVGGGSPAALRRTGRVGDGWMGSVTGDDDRVPRRHRRDPSPRRGRRPRPDGGGAAGDAGAAARDAGGKTFYQDHDRVVRRAEQMRDLGLRLDRGQRHGHVPGRAPAAWGR